ncbi:MAG: pentapeptide repeat-containing protein [Cyanobacteria bacterium P01_C01_bin.38]
MLKVKTSSVKLENFCKQKIMKNLIQKIAIVIAIVFAVTFSLQSSPAYAFVPGDLDKLIENDCPKCDLSGADLQNATLYGANLEGASLLLGTLLSYLIDGFIVLI